MKKTWVVIASLTLAVSLTQGQDLSGEQQGKLLGIEVEYAQKASLFEGMIQAKFTELTAELTRAGRLDSEKAAKKAAKNTNVILKEIGGLYGEYVKSRVAFMLEMKDVLTTEQKLHLLANLEPEVLMDYDEVEFLQLDIFDLPINLNFDQRKKLIGLKSDLLVKEVKLECDIEFVLLELESIVMGESIDSAKVDKQIMKLVDLAADAIDNRVDFFIGAKDVLTLNQKQLIAYLIGL
jgi:Spy/CpxP family protein refolding chaperone